MKATEELKKEHNAVRIVLAVLDKMCDRLESGQMIDSNDLDNIIEFLQIFVDKCHHAKEERLLFAAMRSAVSSAEEKQIEDLLRDHVDGRNHVKGMKESADRYRAGDAGASVDIVAHAKNYIALLNQHIERENFSFFPLADKKLSEKKHDELFADFEKLEVEEIGTGRHEQFHSMIDRLRRAYLAG
jgi:hemerythrin-like domain-containing protein